MPRYNRKRATNDSELYRNMFKDRGITEGITQYRLKVFGNSAKSMQIRTTKHTWSMGDRLFKLSYEYYNTYEWWWVIALWNGKPTDAHYSYGDIVEIPDNPSLIIKEV